MQVVQKFNRNITHLLSANHSDVKKMQLGGEKHSLYEAEMLVE